DVVVDVFQIAGLDVVARVRDRRDVDTGLRDRRPWSGGEQEEPGERERGADGLDGGAGEGRDRRADRSHRQGHRGGEIPRGQRVGRRGSGGARPPVPSGDHADAEHRAPEDAREDRARGAPTDQVAGAGGRAAAGGRGQLGAREGGHPGGGVGGTGGGGRTRPEDGSERGGSEERGGRGREAPAATPPVAE